MRNLFIMAAIVAATCVLAMGSARAEEPKETKSTQQVAKDPNYRFHNGQWWYWKPAERNWLVWSGSEWTPYQPGQTRTGDMRSFSFSAGDAADARLFGTPLTTVPENVGSNNQIIGSFGMRGAGSKVKGKY